MSVLPIVVRLLYTALFCVSGMVAFAQGGPVSLVYDLKVGDIHKFRLVTDQHVVGNRAIRVQTILTLEVIDEDRLGNYQCRVTMKTDTGREVTDTVVYRPHGSFRFVGYRHYSESNGYDAIIDALGMVIMGQSVPPKDYEQGALTAFSQTTDVDAKRTLLVPYTVIFSIPKAPDQSLMEQQHQYVDTIYVLSAIQPITSTYGATHEQRDLKRNLDTIARNLTLDSVVTIHGHSVGYMTSLSMKHTVLGQHYTIITQYERDMSTGLVRNIEERCYYESPKGPRLEYFTRCLRITSTPADSRTDRKHTHN
ncbi:MAG: hypothetical protein NTX15_03480 [Candidatus Kapabacteria bacterium]|nr:hypothetical protein [Candidatus Kapabacteria bacterium]